MAESLSKEELLERAEAGNADGMCRLAYLLGQEGDNVAAEYWYGEAAARGVPIAMVNLGTRLGFRGELDRARELFRRAIDAGHDEALVDLGLAQQDSGDLTGAEELFNVALDRGIPGAAEHLDMLRLKGQTDPFLHAIRFETFGWPLCQNRTGQIRWQDGNTFIDERYSNQPPFFTSLNQDEVRADLIQGIGLVESGEIDLSDLVEEGSYYGFDVPRVLPTQALLIDCTVYPIDEVPCVEMVLRTRISSAVHFTSNTFVLFANSFWVLQIDVREQEPIGEREGSVAHVVLETRATPDTALTFDPYDKQWDGLVPVESDPLTRLRSLSMRLRKSISLGDQALCLERFDPR